MAPTKPSQLVRYCRYAGAKAPCSGCAAHAQARTARDAAPSWLAWPPERHHFQLAHRHSNHRRYMKKQLWAGRVDSGKRRARDEQAANTEHRDVEAVKSMLGLPRAALWRSASRAGGHGHPPPELSSFSGGVIFVFVQLFIIDFGIQDAGKVDFGIRDDRLMTSHMLRHLPHPFSKSWLALTVARALIRGQYGALSLIVRKLS